MITLVPAYQRDYKSKKAVQADFDAGKDFIIADIFHKYSGKPANKPDLAQSYDKVLIRYDGNRKVAVFKTK
jgi:hypothetical protein